MSSTNRCAYCEAEKPLQNSHAIPDAFFRQLKKVTGGSLFKVEQGKAKRRTSESGFAKLLCRDCEDLLNRRYDQPTISAVRFALEGRPTTISHDVLAGFICTVLWRSIISPASLYSGYRVPDAEKYAIREAAFERCQPYEEFSFEVAELVDNRGLLGASQLRNTISAPYRASIEVGAASYAMHHFIAAGIFFAAYYPVVPLLAREERHLLRGGVGLPAAVRDISTLSNYRNIEARLLDWT